MAKRLGHDPLAWMAEEEQTIDSEDKTVESSQMATPPSTQETIPSSPTPTESPKSLDNPPSQLSRSEGDNEENQVTINEDIKMHNESSKETELDTPPASMIKDWVKITLDPTVTLSQLKELQTKLKDCVGQRIELIGTQVTRIDTAALQLLLAFISNQEITVSWSSPSEEIRKAAQLLGLSTQLSLPNN